MTSIRLIRNAEFGNASISFAILSYFSLRTPNAPVIV